ILLCSAAWYENIGALFPPETEPVLLARGVLTGPMNSVVITTVLIPGFVSVLLFLVFTVHIPVDGGEQRIAERGAVRIYNGRRVAEPVAGYQYIIDHFIGIERVSGLGNIRHRRAGRDGSWQWNRQLLGAQHHL